MKCEGVIARKRVFAFGFLVIEKGVFSVLEKVSGKCKRGLHKFYFGLSKIYSVCIHYEVH